MPKQPVAQQVEQAVEEAAAPVINYVKRIFKAEGFCHELGLHIPLGHIHVAETFDGLFRLAGPEDVAVPTEPTPSEASAEPTQPAAAAVVDPSAAATAADAASTDAAQ